ADSGRRSRSEPCLLVSRRALAPPLTRREHELELEQGRHLDDPHHRRHLRRHLKKEEAKHAAMKWTLQQAEETRRARAGHEAPGPGVTAA
ncbi:unnamed protein product, partial [Prorocentrum cordatum]